MFLFNKGCKPEICIDKILSDIKSLNDKKENCHKINLESKLKLDSNIEKCYRNLTEILFNSIDLHCEEKSKKILIQDQICKEKLLDKSGLNIVQYCLKNNKNKSFIFLYNNLFDSIQYYFSNVPNLFTIIMFGKNFELLEFFLNDEFLSSTLKKENIVNLLFLAMQENNENTINIITKNFDHFLDERNIETSAIYFIANNENSKLEKFLSYKPLLEKFSLEGIKKLIAISLINQNSKSLELIIKNNSLIEIIQDLDKDILKNILQLGYNSKNEEIIGFFINNNNIKIGE